MSTPTPSVSGSTAPGWNSLQIWTLAESVAYMTLPLMLALFPGMGQTFYFLPTDANSYETGAYRLAFFSVFLIGMGYIPYALANSRETFYASVFNRIFITLQTIFIFAVYELGISILLIVIAVDLGGALYTYHLMNSDPDLVPLANRRLLWNIPMSNVKRSFRTRLMEWTGYALMFYFLFLSTPIGLKFLAYLEGPTGIVFTSRTAGYTMFFFGCAANIFWFHIPTTRTGVTSMRTIADIQFLLLAGGTFKISVYYGQLPSSVTAVTIIPLIILLSFLFYYRFANYFMQVCPVDTYLAGLRTIRGKTWVFTQSFFLITVSSVWVVLTNCGAPGPTEWLHQYVGISPILPGNHSVAVRIHTQDVAMAIFNLAMVVAFNYYKKFTKFAAAVLYFWMPLTIWGVSITAKIICNLGGGSLWNPSWTEGGWAGTSTNLTLDILYWIWQIALAFCVLAITGDGIIHLGSPFASWLPESDTEKLKQKISSTLQWHGVAMFFASTVWIILTNSGIPMPFSVGTFQHILPPILPGNRQIAARLHRQNMMLGFLSIFVGEITKNFTSSIGTKIAQVISVLLPIASWWFSGEIAFIGHLLGGTPFHPSWYKASLSPMWTYIPSIDLTFSLSTIALTGIGTNVICLTITIFLSRGNKTHSHNSDKLNAIMDEKVLVRFSSQMRNSFYRHGTYIIWQSALWMAAASTGLPGFTEAMHKDSGIPPFIPVDPRVAVRIHVQDLLIGFYSFCLGYAIYEMREALQNRPLFNIVNLVHKMFRIASWWITLEIKFVAHFGGGSPFFPSWTHEGLTPVWTSQLVDITFYIALVMFGPLTINLCNLAMIRGAFITHESFGFTYFALMKKVLRTVILFAKKQSPRQAMKKRKLSKSGGSERNLLSYHSGGPQKGGKLTTKNNWKQVYIQVFGEQSFKKHFPQEFPIPMPPASVKNQLRLYKSLLNVGSTFIAGTVLYQRRVTHGNGVGGVGILKVLDDLEDRVPPTEFFRPGKIFHIRLRHSNAVGIQHNGEWDDAGLEPRGCAIKFENSRDDSPLDLLLNTGEFAGFFNMPSFIEFVNQQAKEDRELYRKYAQKYPTSIKAAIAGFKRAPSSYTDLYYYSQTVRHFYSLDGKQRYCKFRLVPYGEGVNKPVPPESFCDEEDQLLLATNHMTDNKRRPNEKRPVDYLRTGFLNTLEKNVIQYRLQVQLYEPTASDTDEVFNPNKSWDTPYHDIAVIELYAPLPRSEIENTSFNLARYPRCLPLIEPKCPEDYNSLNWARARVYGKGAAIRRLFSGYDLDRRKRICKYTVEIHTGKSAFNGMIGDVYLMVIGPNGCTSESKLASISYDFQRGMVSRFVFVGDYVGDIFAITVRHENPFAAGIRKLLSGDLEGNKWFLEKIVLNQITDKGTERRVIFQAKHWLAPGHTTTLFSAVPSDANLKRTAVVQKLLQKYFQDKHERFHWTTGTALPNRLACAHHDALPKEEQFSVPKEKDFVMNALVGMRNQYLTQLLLKNQTWTKLEDFKNVFISLKPPHVTQTWHTDEEFGRQFLNGTHPLWVRKHEPNQPTFLGDKGEELLNGVLINGASLQQELEAGRIFYVDYEILKGIKIQEGSYITPAKALFHARTDGQFLPIAIQLEDNGPIFTPKDSKYDWLLAKLWLKVADGNVHQMISHLWSTHLLMEPFSIALSRNFHLDHPVSRLLKPHFMFTVAINTIGRDTLISEGGIADRVLSIGKGGHLDLMVKAYSRFKLNDLILPTTLANRGVMNNTVLPSFYWRDDALALWNVMNTFVSEFLGVHYPDDKAVKEDQYIQNFIQDMRNHGFEHTDPNYHGVPGKIESFRFLVEPVTALMFRTRCLHASLNFSQWTFYSFVPNYPLMMKKPPPRTKGSATEQSVCETLPDVATCAQQVSTAYSLSSYASNEIFLSAYEIECFSYKEEKYFRKYKEGLATISKKIKERNKELGNLGYPFLDPEKVPSSIAI